MSIIYVDILEPVISNPEQHKVKCRIYLKDEIVVGFIYLKPFFPFKISDYELEFDGRYNLG
jgi:hypothetical protein